MNVAPLPDGYPQFYRSAKGCRLTDVSGREYIDFMCSFGPIILGHHDPEIEDAAIAQGRRGDTMNGPGECLVELAELLVETIPHADWATFSKNGTDATTTCVTIARAATRRRKILVARGSYHGAVPWCTPSLVGVTAEDRAHIIYYDYNDLESLVSAAEQVKGDLAAILATAYRHDVRRAQEMPTLDFLRTMRQICDDTGAALILDDVRAGFRLHLGGSWEVHGIRPDLSAWSKAIANGYPLAAVTGRDAFREAAASIYTTGSFWCSAVPMAAAIATIRKLHRSDAVAKLAGAGDRFRAGLQKQAARLGLSLRQTGPSQMPMLLFEDDAEFRLGGLFVTEALANGVFLHPWHNMFLSLAHSDGEIDLALEGTARALEAVARSA
jgi:glutamate-1-semialdehyde 2,1-aminomutase